jgi:hypothetical protein
LISEADRAKYERVFRDSATALRRMAEVFGASGNVTPTGMFMMHPTIAPSDPEADAA